jgi:ABC-type nitrate/sulfonate/bicarbonate transport system permease component
MMMKAKCTLFASALGVLGTVCSPAHLRAVGASSLMYRAINPLLIGFNAIPKVALVPILVMWFGIGTVPAVIAAFLTAFFFHFCQRGDRHRHGGARVAGRASPARCESA